RSSVLCVCGVLAVRESRTFPGIPDALAHAPAPPFGGFFVVPPPPELPEQPGFLHLPFQQPQGKPHIVVRHRDGQPRLPSGASGRAAAPTRAHDLRAAVLVLSSTWGRHNALRETGQRVYHRRPPPEERRSSRGRAALTVKVRPARSCPFNAAMAACAAVSSAISTKPKPRGRPVSRSVMRLIRSTTP